MDKEKIDGAAAYKGKKDASLYALVFFIVMSALLVFLCIALNEKEKEEGYTLEFKGFLDKNNSTYAAFVDHELEEVVFQELSDYQKLYIEKYDMKEGDKYEVVEGDMFYGLLGICKYKSAESEQLQLDCIVKEEYLDD